MSRNCPPTFFFRISFPVAVMIIMIALTSCTPWYKAYNIDSRDGLTRLSSVPDLIRALQEGGPLVRTRAAEALQEIGPPARDAIPALKEALTDESDMVSQTAANALESIALTIVIDGSKVIREDALLDEEEKAIAVMVSATRLASKNWMTRKAAAYRLAEMGSIAAPAAPALIMALSDDSNWHDLYNEVRRAAAFALGNIGFGATAANPALIRALDSRDYDVRLEVVRALGKIGPKSAEGVVEALTGALNDPDFDVRREAAVSLGNFETYAAYALPALTEASLADRDYDVRREAVKAIGRIKPSTGAALQALGIALTDRDPDVRNDAVIALRSAGPELLKKMLPAIVLRLNDLDETVRFNTVQTLVECGVDSDQVLYGLERLAKEDKSIKVKRAAVEGLLDLRKIEAD